MFKKIDHITGKPLVVWFVYLSALLQGMAMINFPASGVYLKHSLGLTDPQLGALGLGSMFTIIVGAFLSAPLSSKMSLKSVLGISVLCYGISQVLLASSVLWQHHEVFFLILIAVFTAGLGVGLASAPLNTYPLSFFPNAKNTAIIFLYALTGAGPSLGPIMIGGFQQLHLWAFDPLLIAGLCFVTTLMIFKMEFPAVLPETKAEGAQGIIPFPAKTIIFWLFIGLIFLYGACEGFISNWTVIFLQEEKHFPIMWATCALSIFWAALTLGRLLVSWVVLKVQSEKLWLCFPLLLAITFVLLAAIKTPTQIIAVYVLAGVSCSAFYPLSIGVASKRFPQQIAWVSSMLLVGDMMGVGLCTFTIGLLRHWVSLGALYKLFAWEPLIMGIFCLWSMKIFTLQKVNSEDSLPQE